MTGKFTKAEIEALGWLGWRFMQTGPNEFQWVKFDTNSKQVAVQCDETWARDVASVEESK